MADAITALIQLAPSLANLAKEFISTSDTAKRNGPAVRAVIRAENCSGTVSTEIPK